MTILEEKPLVSRGLVCLEQILEVISYKVITDLNLRITVAELTAVGKQVSGAVFESKQDEWKSSMFVDRECIFVKSVLPLLPPVWTTVSPTFFESEKKTCVQRSLIVYNSLVALKMKAVILFFSNTGSTKAMAVTFQKHLEGAGHSVSLHDGFLILKQYLAAGEKEVTPLLSNYHTALKEADVVGMGSYVSWQTIADGAAKLLTEEATPISLFANMKYYFSFSSFGNHHGQVYDYLATYLHKKNEAAKFLGSVGQHDPENHLPLQPPRGRIDEVPATELKKVDDFGKELVARLNGATLPPMHKIVTKTVHPADSKAGTRLGTIKIDADKCIKCYKCVTVCPYNALARPEEGAAVKIPLVRLSSPKFARNRKNNTTGEDLIRRSSLSRFHPSHFSLVLVGCLGLYLMTRRK
ncbi:hypothetical protein BLNAU_9143 [Blattamonas nauphoetae]|uniref:4Fe-4S ferredoxin-type domain-containing protein n=1 Tax=Blattamonas nauphoetae TaxID=2049346 RepID=A0ABQ9XWD7_9EUKA|nr:hypothetical protein BLNAU_9143 [Blattamonas nauphoetae]